MSNNVITNDNATNNAANEEEAPSYRGALEPLSWEIESALSDHLRTLPPTGWQGYEIRVASDGGIWTRPYGGEWARTGELGYRPQRMLPAEAWEGFGYVPNPFAGWEQGEAGVVWGSPDQVREFRLRLWRALCPPIQWGTI